MARATAGVAAHGHEQSADALGDRAGVVVHARKVHDGAEVLIVKHDELHEHEPRCRRDGPLAVVVLAWGHGAFVQGLRALFDAGVVPRRGGANKEEEEQKKKLHFFN